MTAAELAFDIIRRSNSVQATKFAPRGPKADAVVQFMGRAAGHELFITESQAALFAKLMGQNSIIAVGTGNDRFAAFVKDIFSEAKGRTYYLLTFVGFIPSKVPADEDASRYAVRLAPARRHQRGRSGHHAGVRLVLLLDEGQGR
jgi:hypothetical protein